MSIWVIMLCSLRTRYETLKMLAERRLISRFLPSSNTDTRACGDHTWILQLSEASATHDFMLDWLSSHPAHDDAPAASSSRPLATTAGTTASGNLPPPVDSLSPPSLLPSTPTALPLQAPAQSVPDASRGQDAAMVEAARSKVLKAETRPSLQGGAAPLSMPSAAASAATPSASPPDFGPPIAPASEAAASRTSAAPPPLSPPLQGPLTCDEGRPPSRRAPAALNTPPGLSPSQAPLALAPSVSTGALSAAFAGGSLPSSTAPSLGAAVPEMPGAVCADAFSAGKASTERDEGGTPADPVARLASVFGLPEDVARFYMQVRTFTAHGHGGGHKLNGRRGDAGGSSEEMKSLKCRAISY